MTEMGYFQKELIISSFFILFSLTITELNLLSSLCEIYACISSLRYLLSLKDVNYSLMLTLHISHIVFYVVDIL